MMNTQTKPRTFSPFDGELTADTWQLCIPADECGRPMTLTFRLVAGQWVVIGAVCEAPKPVGAFYG